MTLREQRSAFIVKAGAITDQIPIAWSTYACCSSMANALECLRDVKSVTEFGDKFLACIYEVPEGFWYSLSESWFDHNLESTAARRGLHL